MEITTIDDKNMIGTSLKVIFAPFLFSADRSHISTVKKSCGWCALIPHHKRTPPETDWKRINTSSLHRSEIDSPKEKKQMDLARAGEV